MINHRVEQDELLRTTPLEELKSTYTMGWHGLEMLQYIDGFNVPLKLAMHFASSSMSKSFSEACTRAAPALRPVES